MKACKQTRELCRVQCCTAQSAFLALKTFLHCNGEHMRLQVAAANHLQEVTRKQVEGRAKLGVAAFAEALLGIPKILAENSGYDAQVR